MFQIKSKNKDYSLNLLTNSDEIRKESLEDIVKDLNLAPHYCAICNIYKLPLLDLVIAINDSKGPKNINALPIIVKISEYEEKKNYLTIGHRVIVDKNVLARSDEYNNNKNKYSITKVIDYIESDKELSSDIIKGERSNEVIYLLSFRILPINSIVASYDCGIK